MIDSNDGRRRASRRGDWEVRKFRLGEEPSDDLRAHTTAEERLQMMWSLALDAWASAGRQVPDYDRREAPVRKFLRRVS
jgi:hypothetical protein